MQITKDTVATISYTLTVEKIKSENILPQKNED